MILAPIHMLNVNHCHVVNWYTYTHQFTTSQWLNVIVEAIISYAYGATESNKKTNTNFRFAVIWQTRPEAVTSNEIFPVFTENPFTFFITLSSKASLLELKKVCYFRIILTSFLVLRLESMTKTGKPCQLDKVTNVVKGLNVLCH